MGAQTAPGTVLFMLTAWLAFFFGCGESQHATPSGGPLSKSVASGGQTPSQPNTPPTIHSVEFRPAKIVPGKTIHARVAAVDLEGDHIDLEYLWTLKGRETQAVGNSLDLPSWARRGDPVTVAVVASDGMDSSEAFRATTHVTNRRPRMTEIHIQTQAGESDSLGHWVAMPVATDPDGDRLSFRYTWIVNGEPSTNHQPSFERSESERGDEIKLTVWASDDIDESLPLTSAPFGVGNSPPDIVSLPPAVDDTGLFLYVVRATDRDGDSPLTYSLEEGPRGMSIDPTSGELEWQATLKDAGEHEVQIAVDDGNGGSSRQGFYVQVEMVLPPPRPGGGPS